MPIRASCGPEGEQLAGSLRLDEAVLQELPELQVLATRDLAVVAEALDHRPGGMATGSVSGCQWTRGRAGRHRR